MKRTTAISGLWVLALAAGAAAQEPAPAPGKGPQDGAVSQLVASMVKAEAALKSVRLRMKTRGRLPGGLDVTTAGELRVLRATQPGGPVKRFCQMSYTFGDGLRGRLESAETADGVLLFEEDPAFGAVYLRIEPAVVRDLEWAGEVLDRADLPGMSDARARAPLGSGLLAEAARTFDLVVSDAAEHDGHVGVFVRGGRKAGLDEQDPDLPLPDGFEAFVRTKDRALLSARYLVGEEVVQEITIESLEVDAALGDDAFVVEGHGVGIQNVQDHAPMWEQIERAVERAEDKSADAAARGGAEAQVRPSKRARQGDGK
jgi:hypothetical protein